MLGRVDTSSSMAGFPSTPGYGEPQSEKDTVLPITFCPAKYRVLVSASTGANTYHQRTDV